VLTIGHLSRIARERVPTNASEKDGKALDLTPIQGASSRGDGSLGYAIQAMCPEGAPQSVRHIGSKSFARLLILAPLSGRIFAWRVSRVETLG
jgi:hypothetical protein